MNSIVTQGTRKFKTGVRLIVSAILPVLTVVSGIKLTPQPQNRTAAPAEVRVILVESATGTMILEM